MRQVGLDARFAFRDCVTRRLCAFHCDRAKRRKRQDVARSPKTVVYRFARCALPGLPQFFANNCYGLQHPLLVIECLKMFLGNGLKIGWCRGRAGDCLTRGSGTPSPFK